MFVCTVLLRRSHTRCAQRLRLQWVVVFRWNPRLGCKCFRCFLFFFRRSYYYFIVGFFGWKKLFHHIWLYSVVSAVARSRCCTLFKISLLADWPSTLHFGNLYLFISFYIFTCLLSFIYSFIFPLLINQFIYLYLYFFRFINFYLLHSFCWFCQFLLRAYSLLFISLLIYPLTCVLMIWYFYLILILILIFVFAWHKFAQSTVSCKDSTPLEHYLIPNIMRCARYIPNFNLSISNLYFIVAK